MKSRSASPPAAAFLALALFLVFHGILVSAGAAVVSATFNSGTDVPVTAGSYTASGNTVNFTLNYAPVTGATLVVIKNTGLAFINGTFDNLAQGQTVPLTYNGVSYSFVANYYGGSGNDLVLQWASVKPAAWGYNTKGELGDGTTAFAIVPVAVSTAGALSGKTVAAMSAGGDHSLALCSDGTMAAWGDNVYGQLGNNSTTRSLVPVALSTAGALAGKTVVAMAAGGYHSLALCSDGTLVAWGDNAYGQLGNGSTTASSVPVTVNTAGLLAGKTVVAVAAGSRHSLVLCSDGTLAVWGWNQYGQLGNGGTANSTLPVAVNTAGVLAGKTVTAISSGTWSSLVLCSDGTLAAWGSNASGQLGNNSTTNSSLPVAVNATGVLSGKTVVAIAAGNVHCLARCSDGTLAAWGYNTSGSLGNNSTTNSSVPVTVNTAGVLSGKAVATVSAGTFHSLAQCTDGTMASWGYNNDGQLGNNSRTNSSVPVAVSTPSFAPGGKFLAGTTSSSAGHSLALVALSQDPSIAVEQPVGANLKSGVSSVDFGTSLDGKSLAKTFTLRNNGPASLTVFGITFDGTNGSDFTLLTPPPSTVPAGSSATFVVTFTPGGEFHRSGALHIASNDPLASSFTVNLTGAGTGTLAASYSTGLEVPMTAASLTATGSTVNFTLNHTPVTGAVLMVVKNTGLPFITGTFNNLTHGQIVPLTYNGVTYNFVANYYGGSGNDLVLQWGEVLATTWGSNDYGELGNNTTSSSLVPVAVSTAGVLSGKTVVSLSGRGQQSLALCFDGTLAAWGDNGFGQLGNNSTIGSSVPVAVNRTGVLAGREIAGSCG